MPVPASTIMMSSLWVRISRQVVSPPYLMYSLPETGMDPRDPQHLIIIEPFHSRRDPDTPNNPKGVNGCDCGCKLTARQPYIFNCQRRMQRDLSRNRAVPRTGNCVNAGCSAVLSCLAPKGVPNTILIPLTQNPRGSFQQECFYLPCLAAKQTRQNKLSANAEIPCL